MKKTSENEWAIIIKNNWSSFGKNKIIKEDVYDNPKITMHCNAEDLKISTSRKFEHAYKQQIGNIISHKNNNFNFELISGRNFFWPKSLEENLKLEKILNDSINSTTSIKDVNNAINAYQKSAGVLKKQKISQSFFKSSTSLKNAMKKINDYSCEYNCDMEIHSFLSHGNNYVEVHHIIPIKNQDYFSISLDSTDNLLVLCANHHKMFHFSDKKNKMELLKSLPHKNKEFIKQANLTPEDLLELY